MTNLRSRAKATTALVAAMFVLAACGGGDGGQDDAAQEPADEAAETGAGETAAYENPDEGVTADTIKLGWIGDMTGPVSPTTLPIFEALSVYFDEVNQDGGINGRHVELIPKSDEYQGPQAVAAWNELVEQEKILALAGMTGSPGVAATLNDVEGSGIPVVGSAQTIFDQLRVDEYWNLAATYLDVADVALNQYAPETLGLTDEPTVVSVGLDAPSGLEWGAIVENRCEKGLCEYLKHIPVPVQGQDFSAQALELGQLDPDFVMLHGTAGTATVLLNSMDKAGVSYPMIGTFPTAAARVWQSTPESVNKDFAAFHWMTPPTIDSPAIDELRAAAERAGVEADSTDFSHGWVTGMVLHEAIERAGDELNRDSLREALASIEDFDTSGLSSNVNFDEEYHHGIRVARPYVWDAEAEVMEPVGEFEDYIDALSGDYAEFVQQ